MKNIIQTAKIVVLALVLSVGVGYLYAWTGPSGQPPTNNTPTPINVGTIDQVKSAGLGLNSLLVSGPVRIVNGTQQNGYVLTSDATGLASWAAPTGGGSANPPIVCKKTGVNAARDLQVSFTATDCGGTLPNSTYVGMSSKASKDCGMISFNVIQPGEAGYAVAGPGFTIYGLGSCPTNNYTVGAVFIKK